MSIVLVGSTSGSVTLQEPAVAGTTVLDLPAVSGTFITTTGGVAPSTAGNVLTSDGTTWTSAAPSGGVTSLNGQTGAITNTNLYAIGSYIVGRPQNTTVYAVNDTVAGSSLYNVSWDGVWTGSAWGSLVLAGTINAVLIDTGTWRSINGARVSGSGMVGLWVRIS